MFNFNFKPVTLSLLIALTAIVNTPNTFAACEPIPKDSSFWGDMIDAVADFFCFSWNSFCNQPPTGKLSPDIDGSSYSVGDSVSYTIIAEDEEEELSQSCFHVFYQDADPDTLKYEEKWEISGGYASKSGSFSTENWSAGNYYYLLWVYDDDGKYIYKEGLFELTEPTLIDTTAPEGKLYGIESTYFIGDEISLTARGDDDQALSHLYFAVLNDNNSVVYERKWFTDEQSEEQSRSFSTSDWTAGTYYYSLTVEDAAGNSTKEEGSFKLIESAPPDDSMPTEPEPTEPVPADPTPIEPEPTEPTDPVDPIPPEPTPVEPAPANPVPTPSIISNLKTGLNVKELLQHYTSKFDLNDQTSSNLVTKCGKGSCCGCVGDPIDTATGAQLIEYTLLSVQGVLPISFSLSYNSLLLAEGKVGKGWGLNSINARLEEISDQSVKIHWTNNQFNEFIKNGNGEYRANALTVRFDKLVKNADGSFTLSRQNKTVYEFTADGQLATLRNSRGQSLALNYDQAGQLSKITEPVSGVFLSYAYNADGLLERVTDSLGRQVRLGYNNEHRLTTITDANGKITTYTYNVLGQILTAVTSDGITLFSNTYDEQGRVIAQDDGIEGNQLLKLAYDESQPNQIITTVTDRTGKTRVYTYNDTYQLLKIKDELGKTVTYSYDANGNRSSVSDANGNTTQLVYAGNGTLTTITDAAGNRTSLTYDSHNNLLSVTNALGKRAKFTYDANNHLISTTDVLGSTRQYTYNDAGQILTVTSPRGAVTRYVYKNGLPIHVADPEGNTQTLGYDAAGRLITVTDAQAHITTLAYDDVNRLVLVTDALNRSVHLTYDSLGNLLTVTDANGNVTRHTYDGNGNLISQINALNHETRYVYDGEDRLIKVIDAKGHTTQLGYDAKSRLVSVTNALGKTRKLSYDAADNLLEQIDALGKPVVSLNYDVLNNPTDVTDTLGNTTQFEYDILSRLTRVTDPLNNVTQFNYDELNRLVASQDAEGGQSSQSFDSEGNLTTLTDPKSNQTGFQFDNNGRLVAEQSAAGGSVRYTYNARDLLVEVTNARGQQRQFEYDAVDRLTRMTDPDGEITYRYDANDNVLTVTDTNGTISREYDALDRVVKYTDSQGNTLQYVYDTVGNLVTLTYPDGKQVHYAYNAADQLSKVTDWAGRETRYSYDANGRLVQVVRPNSTQMTRSYDIVGQLVQQQDMASNGEVISQFDFVYDATGDIIEEAMLPEPELFPLLPVKMTHTAANRLATFNGEAVTFDTDGNMTQGPLNGEMVDFAFDSRNRLVNVGVMAYRYDAENQRIGVSVAGKETHYVINSQAVLSQVLVKTAPDGQQTYYVYGLGLIGQETNGVYQAYHFDLRGSTVAFSDAMGNVIERFQYSPYGGLVSGQSPVEIDTPFLFNGMYGVMTDDTGLYYMRARYYNPEIRRFVNQDPLMLGFVAEGQTLNRYAYVTGEPISYVDPFGLSGLLTESEIKDWKSDWEKDRYCFNLNTPKLTWKFVHTCNSVYGRTSILFRSYQYQGLAITGTLTGISETPHTIYSLGDKIINRRGEIKTDYEGFMQLVLDGWGIVTTPEKRDLALKIALETVTDPKKLDFSVRQTINIVNYSVTPNLLYSRTMGKAGIALSFARTVGNALELGGQYGDFREHLVDVGLIECNKTK